MTGSDTQINLDWDDSTDNVQTTGYDIWRCSGVSCSNFAYLASVGGQPAVSNYPDSGLTASTSYSYKVRALDAATPTPNTSGFSTTATAVTNAAPSGGTNIILNPDFETNTTNWTLYSDAAGEVLAVNAPGYGGSANSGRVYLPSNVHYITGVPTVNVQLYQIGISLEPETNYRLSFYAKSSTGNNMDVFIQKHGSPYTNYGLSQTNIDLTTGWVQYSYDFTTTGFSTAVTDARLRFWMAPYDAAGDYYYFDNVVLEDLTPAIPSEKPAKVRGKKSIDFRGGFLE